MKEIALHVLDITGNSTKAGATLVEIIIEENDEMMTLTVRDNGCGMDADFLSRVTDPYTTTRTTRKVGLGLPLLRLAAEQAGGYMRIESTVGKGTNLTVAFGLRNVDRPPLGDMASTMATVIQGAPEIDFTYLHTQPGGKSASLDTREIRAALDGVPLSEPEVLAWITESLGEEERALEDTGFN